MEFIRIGDAMPTKYTELPFAAKIDAIEPVTPRIKRLMDRSVNEPIHICSARTRLATESWKQTEGQPLHIRRAKLFEKICDGMPIKIFDEELIVGSQTPYLRGVGLQLDYNPKPGFELMEGDRRMRAEQSIGSLTPEDYDQIVSDTLYWKDQNPGDRMLAAIREKYPEYNNVMYCCTRSYANFTNYAPQADYDKVLSVGIRGIINRIDSRMSSLGTSEEDEKKRIFLDAMKITLEAFIRLAHRYGDLAKELADAETDPYRKSELLTIAENCYVVPEFPAKTYWQALQCIRFIHLGLYFEDANGAGASLCRMDQYLDPIYEKELSEGTLTREWAAELLAAFWIKIAATDRMPPGYVKTMGAGYVQSRAILGGVKRDGTDACNEQTYMILHVGGKMRLDFPLFLRWHPGINRAYMLKGVWTNMNMGSEPAFHNDENIIRGLVEDGASLEDARDYTLQGCTHPHPHGTVYGTPLFVNGAKVFELTMYDGYDPKLGKQTGPHTGDPRTFKSMDDWMEAFKKQWAFFYDTVNEVNNLGESVEMTEFSMPFASALTDDCIEKGKGVHEGGCRYNQFIGDLMNKIYADVPDALSAIEDLVYNKKLLTMDEVLEACRTDFAGERGEQIRQMLEKAPKFGNGLGRPEEIFRQLNEIVIEHTAKRRNWFDLPKRDTRPGGAIHMAQGLDVGALPSGRHAGQPLSDGGISPCTGCDTQGPTVVMESVGEATDNYRKTRSAVLNQKIPQTLLTTPEERDKFVSLLETYFEGYNGYQVQWNIQNRETFEDAMVNPKDHKDLIVRVGGYSAYYVELSKKLQQQIIDRTEQHL
ncbi:MAG: hypothetical protein II185_03945 [Firmicutes bacterium]|nr:hypothetical protein [Bacillota bacterium]